MNIIKNLLFIMLIANSHRVFSAYTPEFSCGGVVESATWQLWDEQGKWFLQNQLTERLKQQGDVYALYNFQVYSHNLVAMARRCQRWNRLAETAEIAAESYQALETAPDQIKILLQIANSLGVSYQTLERESDKALLRLANFLGISNQSLAIESDGILVRFAKRLSFEFETNTSSMAWICRGGNFCNTTNKLLNHEVMLNSVQFLALTSSLANALSFAPIKTEPEFIEQTALISISHLLRWSSADPNTCSYIEKLISASAEDVSNTSSMLFFTDTYLWMIAVYADLAGILYKKPELIDKAGISKGQIVKMHKHLSKLLELFSARTSLHGSHDLKGRLIQVADIDRGYWRLYADNRYAGYEGLEKPVKCIVQSGKPPLIEKIINDTELKPVDTIGWDISHASRLVYVFDAISRNREALTHVFSLDIGFLPSIEIMRAFANQLFSKVWNGSYSQPLFSNYWSGANGWYRVAYDNGTNECREGTPPFGLSDAFPAGGYATWASLVPEIRELSQRLYRLSLSTEKDDQQFIEHYYSGLSVNVGKSTKMLNQLMFWPSLVESKITIH